MMMRGSTRIVVRRFSSSATTLEELTTFCKTRGFVYEGSSIYGGFANTFDYGPLGTLLKKNLQDMWWRDFIVSRMDCVALDTSIIVNPQVWHASGHVEEFTDPLVECRTCNKRVRADHLLEQQNSKDIPPDTFRSLDSISRELKRIKPQLSDCKKKKKCDFGNPRNFNLLFRSQVGCTEDTSQDVFLRPETAQGVYVNFTQVMNSMRRKLPCGVGQIGKSFRNEITLGNYIFRTREFEQMELQYFCENSTSMEWYDYWVEKCETWLHDAVGLEKSSVRRFVVPEEDRAHYSRAQTDLEFQYPWGWDELWGIANRGSYDLKRHASSSSTPCTYRSPDGSEIMPHVVEPALGLNRLMLAVLTDAYDMEETEGGKRTVLRFKPTVAPYQFAILPLVKKSTSMVQFSEKLYERLAKQTSVDYDLTGSIGKRYRRQDEIGTPTCVTVDSQTLEDGTVTIRARDTMNQRRVHVDSLVEDWKIHCKSA